MKLSPEDKAKYLADWDKAKQEALAKFNAKYDDFSKELPKHAKAWFTALNLNGDGFLEKDEFLQMFHEVCQFNGLDFDGSLHTFGLFDKSLEIKEAAHERAQASFDRAVKIAEGVNKREESHQSFEAKKKEAEESLAQTRNEAADKDLNERIKLAHEKAQAKRDMVAEDAANGGGESSSLATMLGGQKEKLQERGEKLDEMSDKAGQMNDQARDFASLAAQLRRKAEADLTCVVS